MKTEPAGIVGHLDIASTCIGSRVLWAAGVRGLNLIVSVAGAVREMFPLRIVKLTC